ncbi:sn-glycerol-3-phosphate ABC transporter permease UgpA [Marinomonas sp. UCMA 3892]|jgi:sn-glycerol 3-phosphate transport system permease protein|uniref:sn-glycerol-3-phosphate transport system permease protein UgpA n=2 Tax=Marinomonas TaxID=28253 RepID=A0A1M4YH20_9GAMM|nr:MULTISPECIES: sn-glycerol-3-phosphate ABC transporter permease UgpA [Marinomonas]MBU1294644.1 sn-glycerol-3-phosphate ABC transporter permease UgpA [Gammaproteobacteria bacterium]MBU1466040.1 sn-glycerol-3-phosphate ABC transporter permease UgpA [Gammaproteobacteria bacterium]MBU2024824.1 sn-glycerol-3-phosphate ABC transporter permease UgpA [Gammaproteobacteria bacterium]MBU2240005.1 sn-glycerol-3-phosphate ABC transporter permease UgpA [Gammaproteobacteria bacterium]MBU2319206.1 sn-glycer|tara:strand:+ start:5316 stop:6194 length:879 start_codon:yes stop_codon:yes gene_type:complete
MTVTFPQKGLPWLLLLPQLLVTAIFFLWPAEQALEQAFYQEDAFGLSREFIGLENFAALFTDPLYYQSMLTTLVFSFSVAIVGMSLALLLAVMADRVIRGKLAYQTLLIWPYAVAPALAGVLWWILFDPSMGPIALWLKSAGVDWNHYLNGNQAMILVVIASTWKQISYNFLFFLAGLQAVPRSLIEAAAIDGASPFKRFWTIVFPLLSPTTFFLLVVNLVYAFFETFGVIDATTKGGPGQSTTTLVYKVFNDGFVGLDLGGSAAQSVVLMAIVGLMTVIQFRFIERKVQYS